MKNTSSTLLKTLLGLTLVALPSVATSSKIEKYLSAVSCMTANLYFEARGESKLGKAAVADVTNNRVNSKRFPSSVCSVVFQRKQFSWTFQKSWSKIDKILQGDLRGLKPKDKKAYEESLAIAKKSLKGNNLVLPEQSLHYHATYVKPKWAKSMQKHAIIDSHIFYRN